MSLGKANEGTFSGKKLVFKENKIDSHSKLNAQKLAFCAFLSIRGSSFDQLDIKYLLSLLYVDIAESLIKDADFCCAVALMKLVRDGKQKVKVNTGVVVEILGKIVEAVVQNAGLPVVAEAVAVCTKHLNKAEMTDSIAHAHKADLVNKLSVGKAFKCDFND